MNLEFQTLSRDSVLKGTAPDELVSFSNKLFMHEVQLKCPFWFSVMNGACAITSRQLNTDKQERAVNVMAFATSVIARHRNPMLSALAYRISLILFKRVINCSLIQSVLAASETR